MKKFILVLSVISALALAGCSSNENMTNNNLEGNYDNKTNMEISSNEDEIQNGNEVIQNENTSTNKINFKDNFITEDHIYDSLGKSFELDYKATLTNENSHEVKYDKINIDWYFQKNELLVDGYDYTINFNNKVIKDVWKYNKTDWTIGYSMKNSGDTSEIDSGLIILFEDGTVGNLKVSDIIKGSNNIVLFDKVDNVEWLCEGYVLHSGTGRKLYGVNCDGHIVFSYLIDPGV